MEDGSCTKLDPINFRWQMLECFSLSLTLVLQDAAEHFKHLVSGLNQPWSFVASTVFFVSLAWKIMISNMTLVSVQCDNKRKTNTVDPRIPFNGNQSCQMTLQSHFATTGEENNCTFSWLSLEN